jgi:hypothetical protein
MTSGRSFALSAVLSFCVPCLILSSCGKDNPGRPVIDETPPSAVTDLSAVDPTDHGVTLTWTAPGGNGHGGTAAAYDIRYYLLSLTEDNWDRAFQAQAEPAPKAAGSLETFMVQGLAANNDYYFALKTSDAQSNVSGLSNVVSARTLSCAGCWWPLGLGVSADSLHPRASVSALGSYNGLLAVAGSFDAAGDVPTMNVAFWDGSSWSALSSGISGVTCLAEYDGRLIAGGGFSIAGDVPASNVAAWNGASWSPLGNGLDGSVYALAVYDGRLIAGGSFTSSGGSPITGIAAWDGGSWASLGVGVNGAVFALAVYNGGLIAAGNFTAAGGGQANYIAAWDGSAWAPLGLGLEPIVSSLAVHQGRLIAGGEFTTAGGVLVRNIAAWDGGSWSALGEGIDVRVGTLAVYDDRLIAGGTFTTAGGVSAANIAAWDGSFWSAMESGIGGVGFSTAVYTLTVYNGALIAGGRFDSAGGYTTGPIAGWSD